MTDAAVETIDLGKRYGKTWALQHCSIEVPTGRVCGLVGANGAGKTTLMRMLAGLSRPTTGRASVVGREPVDDRDFLRGIGYLAQEVPLFRRWNAADHLALGAHMNPSWDEELTRDRLRSLHIPFDRPMEALSGGMRAQVALASVLGKRPQVLLLDEPVAALDPLARHDFLASLAAAVADGGVTVLMSSHLLPDLERVCDHLVLIADAQPVICGDIEHLLDTHKLLTAAARDTTGIERLHHVITSTRTPWEVSLTVELTGPVIDPAWRVEDLSLEEIVLAYLGHSAASARVAVEEVRMSRLLWRQHRSQAFVAIAGIGLFAVAVVITGLHMAHIYKSSLAECTSNGTCNLVGNLFSGYGAIIDLVHLSIALPIILGTFVGVTLVARERESATNVLVWTQTVTCRRWLFSKVAAVLAGTVLTSAVVSALVTWWSNTPNALNGDRFEGAQFDTQNILPVALALFAVALGIAAGCLLRRTLPALATTVGAYVGVRLLVTVYLRPHYLHPLTRSFPLTADSALPSGSWTMKEHLVDAAGKVTDGRIPVPASCGPIRDDATSCLSRLGYHQVVTYQPPGHYWPFQWIESGIFVGLAAVLIAVAVVYTLRRDA